MITISVTLLLAELGALKLGLKLSGRNWEDLL